MINSIIYAFYISYKNIKMYVLYYYSPAGKKRFRGTILHFFMNILKVFLVFLNILSILIYVHVFEINIHNVLIMFCFLNVFILFALKKYFSQTIGQFQSIILNL